jgi:hypothetical protein
MKSTFSQYIHFKKITMIVEYLIKMVIFVILAKIIYFLGLIIEEYHHKKYTIDTTINNLFIYLHLVFVSFLYNLLNIYCTIVELYLSSSK